MVGRDEVVGGDVVEVGGGAQQLVDHLGVVDGDPVQHDGLGQVGEPCRAVGRHDQVDAPGAVAVDDRGTRSRHAADALEPGAVAGAELGVEHGGQRRPRLGEIVAEAGGGRCLDRHAHRRLHGFGPVGLEQGERLTR